MEGREIGNIGVPSSLAGEVSLDETGFEDALRSRTYREAHRQALHHADKEAGVSGVPMFGLGNRVLTGLQDRETLETILNETLARSSGRGPNEGVGDGTTGEWPREPNGWLVAGGPGAMPHGSRRRDHPKLPKPATLPGRMARHGARMFLLVALLVGTLPHTSPAQEGAVRGVHDPCLIKEGGTYYLFSTGPGIPIRRSTDLWHWERAGRVFPSDPKWFAREVPGSRGAWAPDIALISGTYHLYYSVSTFGSNRSCIGLATNRTLDPARPEYRWADHGPVLRSTRRDDHNAIDPNVVFDGKGKPWLAFGSHWGGLRLTGLDPRTGQALDPGRRIALASRPTPGAVEAPFLVRRGGVYYLFASFDQCCKGVESTYNVVVGRSPDLAGPYRDREGRPMMEGGGTRILASSGRVRGPGHCAILNDGDRDWFVHHFYDAESRGAPTLQVRPLTWGSDGFPIVGEPIDGPVTPMTGRDPTR